MTQTPEERQAEIDRQAMETDAEHLRIIQLSKHCTSTLCGTEWFVGYIAEAFLYCPLCGSVLTDDIEKRGGQYKPEGETTLERLDREEDERNGD